ncbi:MAG TPA: hypothetical protein VJH37_05385 [Candidatus Nanoarchaeia archaeon]|nr:hypothetical protein [Candidatus Nanoarchaeia archaeon]
MNLQYLLNEHTKYDGCIPLRFGDKRAIFFLQPPEVVAPCLDEVIIECVLLELELSSGARIDQHGKFYMREREWRKGSLKEGRTPLNILSLPNFLKHLKGLGYNIPMGYWNEKREALLHKISSHSP